MINSFWLVTQDKPEAMKRFFLKEIDWQLCLCDRYIREGDEVLEILPHGKDIRQQRKFKVTQIWNDKFEDGTPVLMIGDDVEAVNSEHVYKHIAKLTKDSLEFAKEGMEFSDNEFELTHELNTRSQVSNSLLNMQHGLRLIAKLKCPACTQIPKSCKY